MTNLIGTVLFDCGWVQGTYLFCETLSTDFCKNCWPSTKDLSADLIKQLTDKRNALILISQNCDIVSSSPTEKTLEFVVARRPKKKNPPYFLNLDARSTRNLEIELSDGCWYKAEASKILQIDKNDFLEEVSEKAIEPSKLTKNDCEVLARWRANRYMRVALPDSFENKIKPLREDHVFDEGLEHAGSLYLNLEPFKESDSYIVRVFALHRKGSPNESFEGLFEKMEQVINSLNAIEGITCPYLEEENNVNFEAVYPAMRRNEVSVELLDHFVRWNFDFVSLKEGDNEGIDESI